MQYACLFDSFYAVWPTIFALDLSRYFIAAGALSIVLAVFAKPLAYRRTQSTHPLRKDYLREIGYSLSTVILFSLVGFSIYLGSKGGVFNIYGGELPGIGRLTAEFIAIVLLHDAYFYWAHRAMHTRWLYRLAHRIHHKSKTPSPWAAYAFAPLEAILEAGILILAALLFPLHQITVFLFVTHMIARNVIGHAGIELFPSWWLKAPLLRWITTTTHHDLHHSHGGSNFGLYFTWWDKWMNTEHPEYVIRFMAATRSPRSPELSNERDIHGA